MVGRPQQAGRSQSLPAARAGLLLRDNLRHRNTIERAYRKAIGQARHDIVIANAYFLPGGRLRRALIKAARRSAKDSNSGQNQAPPDDGGRRRCVSDVESGSWRHACVDSGLVRDRDVGRRLRPPRLRRRRHRP
jgi:phosphatidylserine/phosphatidylglycerophosphate/cardiolipin synthase-like enzyme